MPGDEWQKFANLRTLYTYMWTHPGARLLFMGNEFGQTSEWNYKGELNWKLLDFDLHRKLSDCITELNSLLVNEKSLHQNQFSIEGFEWIDLNHRQESVMAYSRKGEKKENDLLIILNLTPVVRNDWQVEVSGKIYKKEIFNSDDIKYGGTGSVYNPELRSETIDKKKLKIRLTLNLPPLAAIILK
jgi:1,4-alpha-glucan branching enzyme